MNDREKSWRDLTESSIANIEWLLQKTNDPYEEDFNKLANWIYRTECDLYSFMSPSWKSSIKSAETFSRFLSTLYHSMCDDGGYCFAEFKIHGSILLLCYPDDTDKINDILNKEFALFGITINKDFVIHTDVKRFINHVEAYNSKPVRVIGE